MHTYSVGRDQQRQQRFAFVQLGKRPRAARMVPAVLWVALALGNALVNERN